MRVKVRFWVVLFLCTMFSVDSFAQRVYVEGGNAIIDCSGMPEACVKSVDELNASKTVGGRLRRHQMYSQEGIHITGTHGTTTVFVNAKVSRKFVVAPTDIGPMYWAAASGWASAANSNLDGNTGTAESGCATYSANGLSAGGWRMPTQRELMIIHAHKGQLERVDGFSKFLDKSYWIGSDFFATSNWLMEFKTCVIHSYDSKAVNHYVRCISDL